MAEKIHPLLAKLRAALKAAGNATNAKAMQAYMKSAMPMHGVPAPRRREILRGLLKDLSWPDAETWAAEVRAIWHGAKFREERYAALSLVSHRRARAFQTPEALPLYEELIVDGAWWDFVDELAANAVGGILRTHPVPMKKAMRSWSRSDDMWKRRTAILCQLTFKEETDRKLLYECIEPVIDSKEFFLRKAIGWALRQYARVEPKEVAR